MNSVSLGEWVAPQKADHLWAGHLAMSSGKRGMLGVSMPPPQGDVRDMFRMGRVTSQPCDLSLDSLPF